jgi:hypothetical protein
MAQNMYFVMWNIPIVVSGRKIYKFSCLNQHTFVIMFIKERPVSALSLGQYQPSAWANISPKYCKKLNIYNKNLFLFYIYTHTMSWDQNAGRSYSIQTEKNSFERAKYFGYLGTTLTNQNFIQEEIKSRLKSGNACYNLVQNFCLPICCPEI